VANILTAAQAANALRVETTDPRMLDLLPQVDLFIQSATGRDWTQDQTKHATAISAATMLLVQWYENPAMLGAEESLSFGLIAALAQLEAEALKYHSRAVAGLTGAGSILLPGAQLGDEVISVTGIYGVSGDQSANFESSISVAGLIQQSSTDDLSDNLYVVIWKSPAEDVIP
jgi:hypothetical protein